MLGVGVMLEEALPLEEVEARELGRASLLLSALLLGEGKLLMLG